MAKKKVNLNYKIGAEDTFIFIRKPSAPVQILPDLFPSFQKVVPYLTKNTQFSYAVDVVKTPHNPLFKFTFSLGVYGKMDTTASVETVTRNTIEEIFRDLEVIDETYTRGEIDLFLYIGNDEIDTIGKKILKWHDETTNKK